MYRKSKYENTKSILYNCSVILKFLLTRLTYNFCLELNTSSRLSPLSPITNKFPII